MIFDKKVQIFENLEKFENNLFDTFSVITATHSRPTNVFGIFNFLEHIRNVSFHRKKDFVIFLFLFEKCHSTDEIDNKFLNFLFYFLD